ncbi:response regulator transcription factor [Streptomyces sp. NPDC048254]|uniref:response regulator transcription factor n=1 Tax=Streptomyces sp. NPDC048254 TaxID=3365525 RepID=UPI0037204B27
MWLESAAAHARLRLAAADAEQAVRPHRGLYAPDRARAVRGERRRGGRRGYGNRLSPRQSEVVRLLLRGMTNRQTAGALSRSPSTVGAQLKSAMREYGVTTRTAPAVIVSRADGD